MKKVFYAALIIMAFLLMPVMSQSAEAKFIRVYRDDRFDMYANTQTIVRIKGVTSFWVKSVYSDAGKAIVRTELPGKQKKAAIEYGMDYFQYDSKKGKYNMKMCSVYAKGGKEIFRQGSKKWLPVKSGTVAAAVLASVNDYLAQKDQAQKDQ